MKRVELDSGVLLRADHDLGDEVDDGAGRLLRVVLSKQVAHVVHAAARLPGYEPEYPVKETKNRVNDCKKAKTLNDAVRLKEK